MAALLRRRRGRVNPADVQLAGRLEQRRQAAKDAESALQGALAEGRTGPELAALRRALDARLADAVGAADAAYRVALGPVGDLPRVKYLARLTRREVREADWVRRQLALARAHYLVAGRDDLGASRPYALPPTIGTQAVTLGTHPETHDTHQA